MDEYCPEIEYYFPKYETEVRPHGARRPVRVTRPVFPGYIFVRNGEGDTRRLTGLPVRAYWVQFGGKREEVSDRVIERLKEFESAGELVREVRYVNPYRRGVRVYVHMDVADLVATVVKVIGNRALVEVPVGTCLVPIHCLEVA
jgi:hypothetical protein